MGAAGRSQRPVARALLATRRGDSVFRCSRVQAWAEAMPSMVQDEVRSSLNVAKVLRQGSGRRPRRWPKRWRRCTCAIAQPSHSAPLRTVRDP